MSDDQAFKKFDLSRVQEDTAREPKVSRAPMSDREKAGVNLTWGVLVIIGSFLLIMISLTAVGGPTPISELVEVQATDLNDPGAFELAVDQAVSALETQRQSRREFIIQLIDRVLVNVLLPVLTALLGYIFGTSDIGRSRTEEE